MSKGALFKTLRVFGWRLAIDRIEMCQQILGSSDSKLE